MKDWVIWGNAGHALVIAEIISAQGGAVAALVDRERRDPVLAGVPILEGADGLAAWLSGSAKGLSGVAAIGGGRGRDRLEVHTTLQRLRIVPRTLVADSAIVSRSAELGRGTQVLPGAVIGPKAVLGEACIINHRASVDHECRLGDGVHVSPGATLTGLVEVGDLAWIGAGATVLPRLRVGEGAIIGAGAVVLADVPPGLTVAGVPAKPIGSRNGAQPSRSSA